MSDNETKAREIAEEFFVDKDTYNAIHRAVLEALSSKDATIAKLEAEVARLKAENELLAKDCAFYRCCAVSGEVPIEGSAPSE
jgi:hypothetical protein